MSTAEPWYLGIDFGTSSIVAAQRRHTRAPEIIELGGERSMPSVVVVDEHGTLVVGRAADNLAAAQPNRALRAPKARIGDPAPVVLAGRAYRAVELVGRQLQSVYLEALAVAGSLPAEVRVTHPASWSSARVAQLLEAATLAGIDHPQPVPEPVAAAAAYAEAASVPDGGCVAVYDLGGGTFDSAVLQATRGGFVIIGRPGGEDRLGGNLFDELLANQLGERLDPEIWERLQVSEELPWRQAAATLKSEARKAKEALSAYPSADVLLALPGGMAHLQVTRAELDTLTRPYLRDSVIALERTIGDAGLHPGQLHAIFLTGGASRMPAVEELVAEAFPSVPVTRRGDPKTAVAVGATHPLAVVSGQPRPPSNPPVIATAPGAPPAGPSTPPPAATPPTGPPAPADPARVTQVVPGLAVPTAEPLGAPAFAGPPPTAVTGAPPAGHPGPYPPDPYPPASAAPGSYPPGSYPPGSYPPGSYPPGSYPPGSAPRRRRAWLWAVLAVVLVAGGVAVGLLMAGGGGDDTDVVAPTTQVSQTVPEPSTTSAAPVTTASTAPPTTAAPVTVTVTVPVPVPVPGPTTTAPPPTPPVTVTPANSCPATAANQNRTPAGPSTGVVEYTTEGFVARICWTGSEYLYYGFERSDPTVSVLIGAVPTATGWEAVAGGFRYTIDDAFLVVYQGAAVILEQAVLSRRDLL
ncbi:MAG: Hsp70 family protein [Acidimicrobiales bacterium]